MPSTTRTQRRYDHRLRELVCNAKSVDVAVRHGVPRSTARGWLAPLPTPVVTLNVANQDAIRLQQEVIALRRRIDRLVALLRLMVLLFKVSGFSIDRVRLPEDATKERLLRAIDRARSHFSLRAVLRIAGLSQTRYHAWSREPPCSLTDRRRAREVRRSNSRWTKSMRSATWSRPMSIGMCLPGDWLGWPSDSARSLPRRAPGADWSGFTAGAGLDNASILPSQRSAFVRRDQRDLAHRHHADSSARWQPCLLASRDRQFLAADSGLERRRTFDPELTAKLLLDAVRNMNSPGVPTVMTDGGSENFNSAVDELVRTGVLKRVLAQTDIQFSNSMIESWWRVLKHQWLYLNTLDTLATVQKLVGFYVEQHNTHLPHAAFQGQTPDEMYFGTGSEVPKQLAAAKVAARQARLDANRAVRCQSCCELVAISN